MKWNGLVIRADVDYTQGDLQAGWRGGYYCDHVEVLSVHDPKLAARFFRADIVPYYPDDKDAKRVLARNLRKLRRGEMDDVLRTLILGDFEDDIAGAAIAEAQAADAVAIEESRYPF